MKGLSQLMRQAQEMQANMQKAQNELAATVHLSDGRITVSATEDPTNAVHSMPYDRVESISYSRGRDPMWNAPGGPEPVARLGGGALGGIFRGTRYWLTLKTTDDAYNAQQVLENLASKVGAVLVVLGAMHFLNLYVLNRMRRRALADRQPPPVVPTEWVANRAA